MTVNGACSALGSDPADTCRPWLAKHSSTHTTPLNYCCLVLVMLSAERIRQDVVVILFDRKAEQRVNGFEFVCIYFVRHAYSL